MKNVKEMSKKELVAEDKQLGEMYNQFFAEAGRVDYTKAMEEILARGFEIRRELAAREEQEKAERLVKLIAWAKEQGVKVRKGMKLETVEAKIQAAGLQVVF